MEVLKAMQEIMDAKDEKILARLEAKMDANLEEIKEEIKANQATIRDMKANQAKTEVNHKKLTAAMEANIKG
jgi:Ni,Fe-hydrogenase III component G